MAKIQLDKDQTRTFVVSMAPQYAELLRDLQSAGRWAKLTKKYEGIFQGGALDLYVSLYDDERRIGNCLWLCLLGEEGKKELDSELAAMSQDEQADWMHTVIAEASEEDAWSWMEEAFPDTPEKEEASRRKFLALSEEDKKEASKRAAFFWWFFFATFYNYVSLMLHGRKLTVLVAQAKEGDEDAFCKAIHIEPRLLRNHPYFRDRHFQAQDNSEKAFLQRIGYRLANTGPKGQIRFPGLYMVFAMLDGAGWLEGGFTHDQILDMCDEAGLHRFQNRIEDTNYLTKRLLEYRENQRKGSLSML
jgi:hypothetical protein